MTATGHFLSSLTCVPRQSRFSPTRSITISLNPTNSYYHTVPQIIELNIQLDCPWGHKFSWRSFEVAFENKQCNFRLLRSWRLVPCCSPRRLCPLTRVNFGRERFNATCSSSDRMVAIQINTAFLVSARGTGVITTNIVARDLSVFSVGKTKPSAREFGRITPGQIIAFLIRPKVYY
jgi:hypothetical protein